MTALRPVQSRHGVRWEFLCDCGAVTTTRLQSVTSARTKTCGKCVEHTISREQMLLAMRQHGLGKDAAKALGIGYDVLLRLKRLYGVSIKPGANQYNQLTGFRWSKLSPFCVIVHSLWRACQTSSLRRGHKFSLTLAEFKELAAKPCAYCGQRPCRVLKVGSSRAGGRRRAYRAKVNGADRLNNAMGYSLDNVVPCCMNCNFAKRQMTVEQFKSWVSAVFHYMNSGAANSPKEPS